MFLIMALNQKPMKTHLVKDTKYKLQFLGSINFSLLDTSKAARPFSAPQNPLKDSFISSTERSRPEFVAKYVETDELRNSLSTGHDVNFGETIVVAPL